MGQKLVQHIDVDPDWPTHGYDHRGRSVRLRDVEQTIPAGWEREEVYFVARGEKVYPWRDVGYYADEATGRPVKVAFATLGELLAATPNIYVPAAADGMTRAYLESLGSSDEKLDARHRELFGTPAAIVGAGEDPDDIAPRRRRREVFDSINDRDFG